MFVPLYVQGVMGASATASGIVLTPLMLAMMLTSVGSGQLISRTGRYRWALIAGPVVMGAGFVLLAGMGVGSTRAYATVAMIVTGLGLGLLIQNLSLAVQNGVPSRHLGRRHQRRPVLPLDRRHDRRVGHGLDPGLRHARPRRRRRPPSSPARSIPCS